MDRSRWRRKAWALLGGLVLRPWPRSPSRGPAGWRCSATRWPPATAWPSRRRSRSGWRRRCGRRASTATVLNAGVSGDTSAGGAARLDWVLADQPTHLLVELGGNDALRGLPVDQLRANLDHIVGRREGARRAGDAGRHAGAAQSRPCLWRRLPAGLTRMLATTHDIPLYPFFLDGAVLQDGLMQPDGIHPERARRRSHRRAHLPVDRELAERRLKSRSMIALLTLEIACSTLARRKRRVMRGTTCSHTAPPTMVLTRDLPTIC